MINDMSEYLLRLKISRGSITGYKQIANRAHQSRNLITQYAHSQFVAGNCRRNLALRASNKCMHATLEMLQPIAELTISVCNCYLHQQRYKIAIFVGNIRMAQHAAQVISCLSKVIFLSLQEATCFQHKPHNVTHLS